MELHLILCIYGLRLFIFLPKVPVKETIRLAKAVGIGGVGGYVILCTLTVAVGDCGVLRPDVRHAFPEYRVATDRPSDNIIISTLEL